MHRCSYLILGILLTLAIFGSAPHLIRRVRHERSRSVVLTLLSEPYNFSLPSTIPTTSFNDSTTNNTNKNTIHETLGDASKSQLRFELFCDFQCPYCRLFYATTLRPLMQYNSSLFVSSTMSLTFYDFPLSFHPAAMPAAVAARCAGLSSSHFYWLMQLEIYSGVNLYDVEKKSLYRDVFMTYAQAVFANYTNGLNLYINCYDHDYEKIQTLVQADVEYGLVQRLVTGTPTLFLNGIRVNRTGYEDILSIIQPYVNQY